MKVVIVTGGFDPLHSGHIEYFKAARLLGDTLVVGVNSDDWLTRKKGRPFMSFEERAAIIERLDMVDCVWGFDDTDNSAKAVIEQAKKAYPSYEIIFVNGGDRTPKNIPEMEVEGVTFEFGVGGKNKANSSSWILDEWKTQKTERDWGYWRVLDDKPLKGYKVKELVIYPGKSLSNQRHFKRSELWTILEGEVRMDTNWNDVQSSLLLKPDSRPYGIDIGVWHQASNPGNQNAHILEVQRGTECVEEDIERK